MARSSVREKRKRTLRFQWERLHRARRNDALRRLRKRFARVVDTVVHRYESRGILAAEPFDLLHRGELRDYCESTMSGQWRAMLSSGIQFESDWIKEAQPTKSQQRVLQTLERFPGGFERQATGFELEEVPPSIYVDLTPEMKSAVDNWIARRRVGFWTKLEGVFLTKIAKTIADGIKEGDTLPNLRKRLQSEMNGLSKYAANRIARTETTGAMNYGGQLERADLDIEYKEWVATIDIRTRTLENSGFDHLNANGDVVKNGDFFIVSGEKLLYPGDGDHGASAGNVIHCRCAAVASIDYNANKRPAANPPAETPKPVAVEPVADPIPSALPETLERSFSSMEREKNHDATKQRIGYYKARAKHFENKTEAIRQKFLTLKNEIDSVVDEQKATRQLASETMDRYRKTSDNAEKDRLILEWRRLKDRERELVKELEAARARNFDNVVEVLKVPIGEKSRIDVAFKRVPADRKEAARQTAAKLESIISSKNAKSPEGSIVANVKSLKKRSFYDDAGNVVAWSEYSGPDVLAHELIHAFEHQATLSTQDAVRGFLYDRIQDGKLVRMSSLHRGYGYQSYEVAVPGIVKLSDSHKSNYAGKYYGTIHSNEVLTMGVQELFLDPNGFADRDPEYFRFVVGWLKGFFA